jgi:hypothetical protein
MRLLTFLTVVVFLTATNLFAQTEPTDTDGDGYRNVSTLDHLQWIMENSDYWDENYELDNDIDASDTENWDGGAGWMPIGNSSNPFTGEFIGNEYEISGIFVNRTDLDHVGFFGNIGLNASVKFLGLTDVNIKGKDGVGAVVGANYGSILYTYSSGNVDGTNYVGGFVGGNGNNGIISKCYAYIDVFGANHVGGFSGNNVSTISESYSYGDVSGSGVNINGFNGVTYGSGIINNSFWDTETSGQSSSSGGTGKTTSEMKTKSTYEYGNWDFCGTWDIISTENNGYPFFNFRDYEPIDTDENGFRNISTLCELKWVAENSDYWDENYELDNDIDASDTENWDGGAGWTPIGNSSTRFSGKFNGNGYKIENIYINRVNTDNIGFFGSTYQVTILNLAIVNCNISGQNYVGGLAAICFNTADIQNCYTTGVVDGDTRVGGLIGGTDVQNNIQNCYSFADVNASSQWGGGFIGYHSGTLNNCYSTGEVTGGSILGGLAGAASSANYNNCFWDTETSGQSTSAGGTGKTTSEMKTGSTFTDAEWDFTDVWEMSIPYNYGYPYLQVLGAEFTGYPPLALVSPENNSTRVPTSVDLEWNEYTDALSYDVQVSTASDFSSTVVDDNTEETTLSVDGLDAQTEYFWRVRVILDSDTTVWAMWSFTTDRERDCVYEAPTDTDDNGYINIENICQLEWVSEHPDMWSSNFELDNDIDASDTENWNDGAGWIPLGHHEGTIFFGNFNGNGYAIDGLYINRPSLISVGFIGYSKQNTIENLGITNCNITGSGAVGAINGQHWKITVTNCYSSGSVSGGNEIGGLIGRADSQTLISNCYTSCDVTSTGSFSGAFIGALDYYSEINNCYASGDINGVDNVGGFVGRQSASSKFYYCYTSGDITGTGSNVGGFLGYDQGNNGLFTADFWDKTKNSTLNDIGSFGDKDNITGETTSNMKTEDLYTDAGWDFTDTWAYEITYNNAYPYLQALGAEFTGYPGPSLISPENNAIKVATSVDLEWNEYFIDYLSFDIQVSTVEDFSTTIVDDNTEELSYSLEGLDNETEYFWRVRVILDGDTTDWVVWSFTTDRERDCVYEEPTDTDENGIINISTLCQLEWVSEHPDMWNMSFELDNDIDATDTENWNDGAGWIPIGNPTTPFTGQFDGNEFTLDNLFLSRTEQDFVGFFGYTSGAAITNLGVTNCSLSGRNNVGGFVGHYYHTTTVSNCYITGTVSGNINVGGFVGWMAYGSITNSYTDVQTNGTGTSVSGFVGYNTGGTIQNSFSIGSVEGTTFAAGFVGNNGSGTIENCYSYSNVTGTNTYLGGFAGNNESGIINKSYSTGSVTANEGATNIGGFIGRNVGTVTNCFWDTVTSGMETSAAGTGYETADMTLIDIYQDATWNFEDVWGYNCGLNNGYPYLLNWDPEVTGLISPFLSKPENNAVKYNPNPTLEWEAVNNAVSYDVQLSDVADFSELIVDENTTGTSYDVTGLDFETVYYWRVKTKTEEDESCWSAYFAFTTDRERDCVYEEPTDTDDNGIINIANICQLEWVSEHPDMWEMDFELDNDIDATDTENFNAGAGFIPVGNTTTPFTGNFYGNDFAIDGLYINRGSEQYIGLFGYVNNQGTIIRDFSLNNVNVAGNNYTAAVVGFNNYAFLENVQASGTVLGAQRSGGIAGYSNNAIFNYCSFDGSVTGTSMYIGGIVGFNYYSQISNSYSSGSVTTNNYYVGGIAGSNSSSTIINSYSESDVTANYYYAGGIAGTSYSSKYLNCYATGEISSNYGYKGGLIGYSNSNLVLNSYSSALITLDGNNNGGLIGYGTGNQVLSSYWDTETSGMASSVGGGEGKTTAEMQTESLFINAGWNFDFIWAQEDSYPFHNIDESYAPTDNDANGLVDIEIIDDLRWLSDMGMLPNTDYELLNDIDASETGNWNGGIGLLPLNGLSGVFEGNNNIISNLVINSSGFDYVGFFGTSMSENSEIKNLSLVDAFIKGRNYVGILAGRIFYGKVNNCSVSGTIEEATGAVGGLIGYIYNTEIDFCNASADVNAANNAGGLLGNVQSYNIISNSSSTGSLYASSNIAGGFAGLINSDTEVNKCFSNTDVTSGTTLGGFVGQLQANANISDCYAMGQVIGTNNAQDAGGFAGINYGTIDNSYSTGVVACSNANSGFVGINSGQVNNSFWDMNTSNKAASVAGEGKTTAEMNDETTFTDAGWDFINTWAIGNGNNGYPYFGNLGVGSNLSIKVYYNGRYNATNETQIPTGVLIEFRAGDELMNSVPVYQTSGIIDETGTLNINTTDIPSNRYWVIIKAAGYLPACTIERIMIDASSVEYDFTQSSETAVAGSTAMIQKNEVWQFQAGDFDGNNNVGSYDINYIIPAIGTSVNIPD